jgi:cyclopropane fatty-acyl-phospholipid synthase-like methyltransferase
MLYISSSLMLRVVIWAVSALLATVPATEQSKPRPSASPASTAKSTPDDKVDRPTSEPYTGSLSIFEDPKRADKLQIDRVMDILAIREGSAVADIGAGSGWFTVRAARRVGPPGVVYAVEINEEYVNHIRSRAEKENLANVRTVLGKEDDPLLPQASVDSILLLKTYHEFSKPISMLRAMRKAMRKDALLGIIDRNGAGDDHGVKSDAVKKEALVAGFAFVAEYDFVKPDQMDYFLVFQNTTTP